MMDIDTWISEVIEKAVNSLPLHRQAAMEEAAAAAGEFQPLLQAGLDDAFAVASTKGCKAKETEILVKTALGHF
jgi:hypothetical protein